MSNYLSWHVDRHRIKESLERRRGKCRQCGGCCTFFGITCPFMSRRNSCRIYRFRPKVLCRLPPLDLHPEQVDKHRALNCGFYFLPPEEAARRSPRGRLPHEPPMPDWATSHQSIAWYFGQMEIWRQQNGAQEEEGEKKLAA